MKCGISSICVFLKIDVISGASDPAPTPVDFNYINLPVMNSTCGLELIVRRHTAGSGGLSDIDTRHQLVTGQCHLYSGERRDGVIRKCDREGEGGRGAPAGVEL